MQRDRNPCASILMADDDPDDCALARDAFAAARVSTPLHTVADGADLLAYLRHSGPYRDRDQFPRPSLILLDLNMPRVDGREALRQIKADPGLRRIPVIVFSTSRSNDDVARAYELGCSSYIAKPDSFEALTTMVHALQAYWFGLVALPGERTA